MTSSKEHNNWLTVGEIINFLKKPVASYTSHIIKTHHGKLRTKLGLWNCTTSADCLTKKKSKDLCPVCQTWYTELESTHLNPDKKTIKWHQNCATSRWPHDEWEIAKFFMSFLGDNKTNVKNADSTDLSSLLNVLEWMDDAVFGGPMKRIDINHVKDLRSKVRNAWAHEAKQEMTDAQKADCFQIASDFLNDLDNVASNAEVKTCMLDIDKLKANGVLNVPESEYRNMLLKSSELSAEMSEIIEEVKNMKDDQNYSKARAEELEEEVKRLENVIRECHNRIKDLEDLVNTQETETSFPKTRLPKTMTNFVGRETEVNDVCSFVEEGHGIVSIYGGPGFGKSCIAVHVSHRLCEQHDYQVVFSYLSSATSVEQATRRLCIDLGMFPGEDPQCTLMMWLMKIKTRVIFVLDNVEQLLEGENKEKFFELLLCLCKNYGSQLQIIVTSTKIIKDPALEIKACLVEPLDDESSVELLKTGCPERKFQESVLLSMADLCGHVPLGLHLLAFRLKDEEDPDKVVSWLETTPMTVLDEKVQQVIKKSFEMIQTEEVKKCFVRLAVFDCNFDREAAQVILEKNDLNTGNVLRELKERSLLQQSGSNYSIHRLIQSFLIELQVFLGEYKLAEKLMVDHFLKECQEFMTIYWSKNGFQSACQKIQRKSRYIERIVNICKEAVNKREPNNTVTTSLEHSIVYHSYSIAFHDFLKHTLSSQLVTEFLECCLTVAIQQKDELAQINFLCNLANIKGHTMGWDSNEYDKSMVETKAAARRLEHKTLPDGRNVGSRYWMACSRYGQSSLQKGEGFKKAKKCLDISKEARIPTGDFQDRVYEVFALMHTARIHKKTGEYEASEKLYQKAIEKSEEYFGSHALTISCHKVLGDLHLHLRQNLKALDCYDKAKIMHNKLAVGHSSVPLVHFLKNRATCFSYLGRHDEAKTEIQEACEMAEKSLIGSTDCLARAYQYFALVLDRGNPKGCPEAAEYAHKAIDKNNELMNKYNFSGMTAIIRKVIEKGQRN